MLKRIPVALFAGVLLALCFPPAGLCWLMPFAIMGLLGAIRTLTPRLAFYTGLTFGIGFFTVALPWLWNLFGTGSIGLWAICALYPALFSAGVAWATPRLPGRVAPLFMALLWTSIEILRSEILFPAFPLMGLGYAFVNVSGFALLGSAVGCYGMTFLVVLLSATLVSVLASDHEKRKTRSAMMAALWCVLFLVPRPASSPTRPITVRLVQALSEDTQLLTSLSVTEPGRQPDVILWPEYSFISDVRGDAKEWAKIKTVAQSTGAYLLFGAKDEGAKVSVSPVSAISGLRPKFNPLLQSPGISQSAEFKNTAFLLDPNGEIVATHVKNHTVPFIKDGKAGTAVTVTDTPKGKFGIAICYDLDFPDVSRIMAQKGAEIFLVPSNNPEEWGAVQRLQHAQMFQMRAIECGRWIAVADVAGFTALYAPNGQNTLRTQKTTPFGATLTAGLETHRTIYVSFGWLFPYFFPLGSLVLLIFAMRKNTFTEIKLSSLNKEQKK